jgi:YrbI family 3-deoxy-D-manno-octulosonate 8-phosphate phosphatase
MTDAVMYYTESGDEFKKFNIHDGMGFNLLTKAGVKTGIITTEYTKIIQRRAAKLKIDYVYQGRGIGSKLEAVKDICLKEGISLKETSYIGDDINCIELLQEVGIAACPANAVEQVENIKGIIHLEKKGGEGAVREFLEMLFKQGLIEGNK